MTSAGVSNEERWARHDQRFRDPRDVIGLWENAGETDPGLLEATVDGTWWELLEKLGVTLLVTREYEHLVVALGAGPKGPRNSYLPLPHPSGIAVNGENGTVTIACTRNPNQLVDFAPADRLLPRLDTDLVSLPGRPLVPVSSRFFPGCFYIHELAYIGGNLYVNSVGQNAVVKIESDGTTTRVWWPRCIESDHGPVFGQNHIQLNGIAAGNDLEGSYFSASADEITDIRPGDSEYPVDGRGVVFAGSTREPVIRGLTRPHSPRLHRGRLWLDNSGYGEFGVGDPAAGGFESVTELPGWTRGLCLIDNIAFVGTSRVIPRFRQYAPGLDVESSQCGIHAIDIDSGRVLGSIDWPGGNQVFAVDWLPAERATGFPFEHSHAGEGADPRTLFYSFQRSS